MKAYEVQDTFGIDSLTLTEHPQPRPNAGQMLLKMRAWSLNYRDLMVVQGTYYPNLRLPMPPLSDGVIGILSGAGQVDPMPILMKNVCVQGIFVGSRATFEAMNDAIARHRMRPIGPRVPVQRAPGRPAPYGTRRPLRQDRLKGAVASAMALGHHPIAFPRLDDA